MNELILDNLSEDVIYALAASPHFATDKLCYAARQSGLHVSHDGGATWRSAFESLDVPSLPSATAVALSPYFQSDRTVFVGVPGGLLTTSDDGTSWIIAALPTPLPFITAIAVSHDYAQDGVVLAGSMEDGVFVSEDRGRSWKAWNFGLLDQNIFCIALKGVIGNKFVYNSLI